MWTCQLAKIGEKLWRQTKLSRTTDSKYRATDRPLNDPEEQELSKVEERSEILYFVYFAYEKVRKYEIFEIKYRPVAWTACKHESEAH
jgi:hypothetical protein